MQFTGNDVVVPLAAGGQNPQYGGQNAVTLYFIAYQLVKEDGRMKQPLRAKGKQYVMPPLGESFTVHESEARDIIDRLSVYDKKLGWIAGATTDPQVARAVKVAFENGNLGDLQQFHDLLKTGALAAVTTDALEKELERRKAALSSLAAKGKGGKQAEKPVEVKDEGETK